MELNTAQEPREPTKPQLFPENSWEAALIQELEGELSTGNSQQLQQLQQVCTNNVDQMVPHPTHIHVHSCPSGERDGVVSDLPSGSPPPTTQDPSTQMEPLIPEDSLDDIMGSLLIPDVLTNGEGNPAPQHP